MLGFHKDSKKEPETEPADTSSPPISPAAVSGEGSSRRLGEILVAEGLINELALTEALADQEHKGGFIGQILIEKGLAKQSDILFALVKQCKIPHLSLLDYEINKDVVQLLPKEVCLRYSLLPIDKLGRILTVAMVNPLDDEALTEIRAVCPDLRIKPILCDWDAFGTVVARIFNQPQAAKTGAYDHLSAPAPAPPTPASTPPVAKPAAEKNDAAMQAALDQAVKQAIKSADVAEIPVKEAEPKTVPAKPSTPPENLDPEKPAAAGAADLVASLRDELAGALKDALAPLVRQLAPAEGAQQPGDLNDAMRAAVRDVLRENESTAVARATRHDLEMRDLQREKRLRHSPSVTPGAARRNAVDILQNPEYREESDQRVVAAMDSSSLLEGYTFDSFIVGSANAFTHKICQAVAARPGTDYNPLFIYGDVGLGKTHLINAAGNAVLAANPNARVGFVSASRFATNLTEAMSEGAVKIFRDNYCHWDMLILDDIQFLGGRVEAQEEFFHIFNVLQQESRQIIIAGDKAPDRLGMLEQRLVSRFSGGIVVSLKPPEWETRVAILRRAAEATAAAVNEEVLSLIAMRVASDTRKMLGALRKIQAFAELESKDVSCELASEILSHLGFNEAA